MYKSTEPSVITNPTQIWRDSEGYLHSTCGPAVIDVLSLAAEYWVHGFLHREDGPAIVLRDLEEWWINGKRHREDGPAIVDTLFHVSEWWIDGKVLSKPEVDQYKMEMLLLKKINLFLEDN